MKPTLHLIGLFHTIPNHDYDHCAFTGKVLRFSEMMEPFGYHIIEYANGESISKANEKVQILSKEELLNMVGPPISLKALHGESDTPIHKLFSEKLKIEILKRAKPHDIILHPYGTSHKDLLDLLPNCFHVESGIGYDGQEFGAIRIYDSYTWMHYMLGKQINSDGTVGKWPNAYYFAVHNYLDQSKWKPKLSSGDYLLYVGRVIEEKGLYIIQEIAKRLNQPIKIAGLGETERFQGKNMEFIGSVTGQEKIELFRNAKAVLMPTQYVEPFGIVAIEAMMVGTPMITSNFGAFVETVDHGKTGFRCHTLGDYMAAINKVGELDRKYIAEEARKRWSFEVIGPQYDAIFKQIYDLKDKGWYNEKSHRIK